MKHLKLSLSVFISAMLAGIMISIGGCVYLKLSADGSTLGRIGGALLFAVGLFTILAFGFHLYTGKVGALFLPGMTYPAKLSELLMTLIGNFAGTFLAGAVFGRFMTNTTKVASVVEAKLDMLSNNPWRLLAVAAGCGILMFAAVCGFRFAKNEVVKAVLVLFSVAGFILAGFEHSVADMFYVAASGIVNGKSLGMLGVVVIGNSIGGALMGLLWRMTKKILGKEVE
ncbi:MAG: formate/nitrite transporter family protein [Clostridia bacterium]|nr:formate/nitrite transporter family protein [Clostridia bacterium]